MDVLHGTQPQAKGRFEDDNMRYDHDHRCERENGRNSRKWDQEFSLHLNLGQIKEQPGEEHRDARGKILIAKPLTI